MIKKILTVLLLIITAQIINAQSVRIDSVLFAKDSVSSAVKVYGYQLTAVKLPDSLAGSVMTFLANDGDNANYYNLITPDGEELAITIPDTSAIRMRKILLQPQNTLGAYHLLKLRTGTYKSPTSQSDSIWVTVEMTKIIWP